MAGDLTPDDMPTWAATALTQGYDSPSLRELAGVQDEPRTVRDLFTAALAELGAPHLTEQQALWVLVHTHARSIVAGLISPEEGAELIWELSGPLGLPDDLLRMVGEATDWRFAPGLDPEEIRRAIVAEADRLLSVLTLHTLEEPPAPRCSQETWDEFDLQDDWASDEGVPGAP